MSKIEPPVERGLVELPEDFVALVQNLNENSMTNQGFQSIKADLLVLEPEDHNGDNVSIAWLKSKLQPPTKNGQQGELNTRLIGMGIDDYTEMIGKVFEFKTYNPTEIGAAKPYPVKEVKAKKDKK